MSYSSEFLSGRPLSTAIRNLISKEDGVLRLAISYWGSQALELLNFNNAKSKSIQILCDPWKGSCDPDVLQALLENEYVDLKHSINLHSKVYLGNSLAIVGSANASGSGIGTLLGQSSKYEEAAIATKESKVILSTIAWFDSLFQQCDKLKKSDLIRIREAWNYAQTHRFAPAFDRTSLIELLDMRDSPLKNRGILVTFYVGEDREIEAEIEHRIIKSAFMKDKLSNIPMNLLARDGYEDVDTYEVGKKSLTGIPWNSVVIDLSEGHRPSFWAVGASSSARSIKGGSHLIPAFSFSTITLGIKSKVRITAADMKELKKRWKRDEKKGKIDNNTWQPITALALSFVS